MQALIRICLAVLLAALPLAAIAQVELVMGEEDGCVWCARWHAEVGDAYPKTPEGRAAPLRTVNIRRKLPENLTFETPLRFTPTFVLMHNGAEIARLEGYPGEDFFWPLMGRMLDDAAATTPELMGWRDGR